MAIRDYVYQGVMKVDDVWNLLPALQALLVVALESLHGSSLCCKGFIHGIMCIKDMFFWVIDQSVTSE